MKISKIKQIFKEIHNEGYENEIPIRLLKQKLVERGRSDKYWIKYEIEGLEDIGYITYVNPTIIRADWKLILGYTQSKPSEQINEEKQTAEVHLKMLNDLTRKEEKINEEKQKENERLISETRKQLEDTTDVPQLTTGRA